MMKSHQEIIADLSLYALGSLDPDELGEIEQHLSGGCAECERELAQWRGTVEMLPLGFAEEETPDLRDRLLARIRGEDVSADTEENGRWWTLPLAIAASAIIAFGLVRDFQHRELIAEQQQRVTQLREHLDRTEARFNVVAETLGRREADIDQLRLSLATAERALAVVREPGLRLVRLAETPDSPPASAHVLLSEREGRALVYTFDLPPLDIAKTYELWWITEKEGPVPAGLFHAKAGEATRIEAILPRDLGSIQAAAVTIEPAGGVPKPTGPMVLIGNVAAVAG